MRVGGHHARDISPDLDAFRPEDRAQEGIGICPDAIPYTLPLWKSMELTGF